MDLVSPSTDGAEATDPTSRRTHRPLAALALALIVALLAVTWGSVAGALDSTPGSDRELAAQQLAVDATTLRQAATLLDDADGVAELRSAGATVGTLLLGLDDQRRGLARIDDQAIADAALRAHRQLVRVLDGWAALERLETSDLGSWPQREADSVLKATNRLRDGLNGQVRRATGSVSLDHSRAREVTLKVARYLAKEQARRA